MTQIFTDNLARYESSVFFCEIFSNYLVAKVYASNPLREILV